MKMNNKTIFCVGNKCDYYIGDCYRCNLDGSEVKIDITECVLYCEIKEKERELEYLKNILLKIEVDK